METYDVAVVGGGPGGYAAALRAARLGASVALIEKGPLGGTCLNVGCIPSKTLLRHAEVIEMIHQARQWGIETGPLAFSPERMLARKNRVIGKLRDGIAAVLKARKVAVFQGEGVVRPDRTVTVRTGEGVRAIRAGSVILATGSKPLIPSIEGIDRVRYHTTDTIFDMARIPKSMAIIGGGVIGVELACVYSSLNTDVTIIEAADRILPAEDEEASRFLHRRLTMKKVNLWTGATVLEMRQAGDGISLMVKDSSGGIGTHRFDEVLLAAGRTPNLTGLSELRLEMNGRFVSVNSHMETSVDGIYAVGDLIGGWQLAHVASAEGTVAAANACGQRQKMDYRVVPRCIYTLPEIASVGISEEEAKKRGLRFKTAKYPLSANGKALAMDEDGFVKVVIGEPYGEILGAVMVGPHVTEMISEISAFMYLEGTVEELAGMIRPHPSLIEAVGDAANSLLA